jgi:L-fucose isomerase-like protein
MPTRRQIKLAFCPIGKFVFSHEDALRFKNLTELKLKAWQVDYVSLDGVLPDGMIRSQDHVDAAVEHFQKAGVGAVFMPHCNFGTEGAVGMIGKKLGVPVLLWGPRDEAPLPDGTRLRDTLCGLFASSKVLNKLGVPFTYIENCRVDDPAFERGVKDFISAANVADLFRRGTRVGHIGQRIDFFWTTIINESELLRKFNIEVLPIDMVEFLRAAKTRAQSQAAAYEAEIAKLKQTWDVTDFASDAPLINVLAVRDTMFEFAKRHDLEALAVQDFNSLVDETGAYCFYANSVLADHLAVGLESDIHGAISCAVLSRACGDSSFLSDVTIRHPENDNAVLLWHAGAPLSMMKPGVKPRLGKHWILPAPESGMPHFPLKDGPITVARFDGETGDYKLIVGHGESTTGPDTLNNYVWMQVSDWPKWERRLIEGPSIHHMAMAYGHCAQALIEACKYVPGLEPLNLDA